MNNKITSTRKLEYFLAEAEAEKVLMFQNRIVENKDTVLEASQAVQLQFVWERKDDAQPYNILIRKIIRESQNNLN